MITMNATPAAANANPAAPAPVLPCPDGTPADATTPSQDAAGKAPADARQAFAKLLGQALNDPKAEAPSARDAAKEAADAEKKDEPAGAATADPTATLLASAQLAPTLAVIPSEAKPVAPATGDAKDALDATRAAKGATVALPAAADASGANEQAARPSEAAKPAREPKTARELSAVRDAAPAQDPSPVREAAAAPTPAPAAAPGAMAALAAPAPAPTPVPPMQTHVAAPVHSTEFPREFAAQVQIAVQRGVEQASIQVNPPELGPIELRIEVSNGEARVHVAAEAVATRDAISEAMPRLRELLGSQGLVLADGSVGAQLPQRDPQAGAGNAGAQGQGSRGDSPQTESETLQPVTPGTRVSVQRLLDVYA